MATEEKPPPPSASVYSPLHQYPELILAAIETLNDKNGSNKSSISKHIEATYGNLPETHPTLLSHHLNKMKQSGQLIMVKNNYLKPDPNAPPRRGRGRPPKPKVSLPVIASSKPRGRPPKPRDPLATPPTPKKKTISSGTGRKAGRPSKVTETAPAASPRGRGRPPKKKPEVVAATVGA